MPIRALRVLRSSFAALAVVLFSLPSGPAHAAPAEALVACGHLLAHGGPPQKANRRSELYFCRTGYVGYMNPDTHVADWVVELLTPDRLEEVVPRRGSFKPEEQLPVLYQTKTGAYTWSGFVRGHLAPADNMRFSKLAMKESFYLANVAPQLGSSFNGSKWKSLEQLSQGWARARPVLVIITGTHFEANPQRLISYSAKPNKTNQPTDLLVPDGFYKIIYAPVENKAIAFYFPHESLTDKNLKDFRTSIDALEDKTGYDFFAAYDDAVEAGFETDTSQMWE
ncbi:MAG: DNA/RNA non-specific endonuclease [Alphaproteobacteria bacterium]|nr:MAG: DNA/RNA non-specific endonuclease [Alphaproteobacteria bacterium]